MQLSHQLVIQITLLLDLPRYLVLHLLVLRLLRLQLLLHFGLALVLELHLLEAHLEHRGKLQIMPKVLGRGELSAKLDLPLQLGYLLLDVDVLLIVDARGQPLSRNLLFQSFNLLVLGLDDLLQLLELQEDSQVYVDRIRIVLLVLQGEQIFSSFVQLLIKTFILCVAANVISFQELLLLLELSGAVPECLY